MSGNQSGEFMQVIQQVQQHREGMVQAAQDWVRLRTQRSTDQADIDASLLRVSGHLGQIGGFCDKWTQRWIIIIQDFIGLVIQQPAFAELLERRMPRVVGIQVDFNHKPFRVVGFELKALGNEFKGLLKR
jgi:hypothetical protein